MLHRFGQFELDEPARSLRLQGVSQDIQPRVFDLLLYLVRNAGRVVPKNELMDALWPDLTVTEASLQRAVSLARRALALGGMEGAIRSFVRHGYRFAIDEPGLGQLEPREPTTDGDLATARDLTKALRWAEAADRFAAIAAARGLSPADIDLWALAVECMGRPVNAIPILARAVSAHVDAGDPARAARAAVTLAKIELERAAASAAFGWLERAEALLDQADASRTRAYLMWMQSRMAAFGGKGVVALELAEKALNLSAPSGDTALTALLMTYKGFYNLSLGNIGEGSAQQNHAAAIALSSTIDPITGSLIYCNILWSCRTFADWPRAMQWSDGFESWCEVSFAERPGSCDLHRAEILGAQQSLGDALNRINDALPKLSEEKSWSLGDGYRVRGDIHAMIGDLDAARADYSMAYALGWDAEPGHAVLLSESGDHDSALAALDRVLEGQTWFHLQRRGIILVNAARIAAYAGRRDLAEQYLAEVESGRERWPQPAVQAMITETRAALRSADDPHRTRLLQLARQLWTNAGIEYHAARVRLELAGCLLSAGDATGAATEATVAEMAAARIGSHRLAKTVAAVQQTLSETIRKRSEAGGLS